MSESPIHLDSTGVVRRLNLIPSPPAFRAARPGGIVLPPSEIADYDRWPAEVTIKDQGQYGACNGHATATAIEYARSVVGMTHVPLSAWYVYAILCNGWDRGSSISDALNQINDDGIAPESLVPWGTINPRQLTQSARQSASRFKAEYAASLTTWDEIVSAVALGQSLDLSVCVGGNFSSLDSEGVPPAYRGPGNHAVMVGGGIKTSRRWGKLVRMANSWGTAWGQKGFCWLAKAHIEAGRYFECYSVSAVYDDPQDTTNPPMVA